MPLPRLLLLAVALAAPHLVHGRLISDVDLASGSGDAGVTATLLRFPSEVAAEGEMECEMSYGFLMFKEAIYLSAGSDLLLQILGSGIVGGLFLPILDALPDALLILFDGVVLSGPEHDARAVWRCRRRRRRGRSLGGSWWRLCRDDAGGPPTSLGEFLDMERQLAGVDFLCDGV